MEQCSNATLGGIRAEAVVRYDSPSGAADWVTTRPPCCRWWERWRSRRRHTGPGGSDSGAGCGSAWTPSDCRTRSPYSSAGGPEWCLFPTTHTHTPKHLINQNNSWCSLNHLRSEQGCNESPRLLSNRLLGYLTFWTSVLESASLV